MWWATASLMLQVTEGKMVEREEVGTTLGLLGFGSVFHMVVLFFILLVCNML